MGERFVAAPCAATRSAFFAAADVAARRSCVLCQEAFGFVVGPIPTLLIGLLLDPSQPSALPASVIGPCFQLSGLTTAPTAPAMAAFARSDPPTYGFDCVTFTAPVPVRFGPDGRALPRGSAARGAADVLVAALVGVAARVVTCAVAIGAAPGFGPVTRAGGFVGGFGGAFWVVGRAGRATPT